MFSQIYTDVEKQRKRDGVHNRNHYYAVSPPRKITNVNHNYNGNALGIGGNGPYPVRPGRSRSMSSAPAIGAVGEATM